MQLDRSATIGDVYANPLGRDVLDRILATLGRSPKWLTNPIVTRLSLETFDKVTGGRLGDGFVDTFLELLNQVPERPERTTLTTDVPWWRSAVIYQIYPRSFADSDGDGVGDLRGIIDHLDHLTDLGVDCLWLSPIFTSPGEDNGYDVADYREVDDQFGTLADLDELIAACHERGMRLILDLVVNHTSIEHPWAKAAMADPDGPFGDYYFLRPCSPDAPPNNWTSFFFGPAWRWLDEPQRWVLHLFASGQLDLDWSNERVRAEVADIVAWWLARGVDGFRMDVINYISKAPGLPDGDLAIGELMGFTGIEHYFHGPELHEHLAELRRTGFTRPADTADAPGHDPVGFMVGETPGIGTELGRLLTAPEDRRLDLVLSFDALEMPGHERWDDYRYDLNHLKDYLIDQQSRLDADEWVALFLENHDNPRMISKVDADPANRTPLGKVLATILLLSRGTPFLYQGQEIAAVNQDFASILDLRDVESLNRYSETGEWAPILAGTRDHARTPMRWDSSPHHGFSTGTPWLDQHETSTGFTVAEQRADPNSVLNFHRRLIALRRANPALALGSVHFLAKRVRDYFGWFRELDGETWLVEVNLSNRPIFRPNATRAVEVVVGRPRVRVLAPYDVCIAKVPRK